MPDQHRFWKPKFIMAAAVFVVGTVALFTAKLTGGEWVTASILMLGVFTTGNVAENAALVKAK